MLGSDIPIDLLTSAEMGRADALTISAGVAGFTLMRRAGRAVAEAVGRLTGPPGPVLALCGPGNNGGDGFVAASLLAERGWSVRVGLLGDPACITGDAARAMAAWAGPIDRLDDDACHSITRTPAPKVVIDALFGAGLSRPFGGAPASLLQTLRRSGSRIVAVDVPSGLDGTTGRIAGGEDGVAVAADITVTFFRLKPGHCLHPGRSLCGRLDLADIGIDSGVLNVIGGLAHINRPAAWRMHVPVPSPTDHKYRRGHVAVLAGEMPGAALLAAAGARRIAGYVTVAGEGAGSQAAADPGVVLRHGAAGWEQVVRTASDRSGAMAAVIGPGAGIGSDEAAGRLRARVLAWLSTGAGLVLDADGLTAFTDADGSQGPSGIDALMSVSPKGSLVLTPHAGEFSRLFPDIAQQAPDKLTAAREAAARAGAVIVYKGSDTVVATPDGRAAISVDAPASLATAGTGDVLAGIVAALVAARVSAFDAARIGVWLHAKAASLCGPGLIAEDLPGALGSAMNDSGNPTPSLKHRNGCFLDCRRV